MPTVGEIKALVAQRKIRDLLISHGHRQTHPIVKTRIDNLVARETALVIGQHYVTNLATPTFNQSRHQVIRFDRTTLGPDRLAGQSRHLLPNKGDGSLNL